MKTLPCLIFYPIITIMLMACGRGSSRPDSSHTSLEPSQPAHPEAILPNEDNQSGISSPDPSLPTPSTIEPENCSQVVDQCPVAGGVTWQCKKRFMHGVNYAWHTFAGDFGGIPSWGQAGVAATPQIDAEFADIKAAGNSVVRWWVLPDFRGAGVSFDANDTPTGLGPTFAEDLLKALELAEKHDLYLMLTIFSFDNFKPTRIENNVTIRGLQPMIIDPVKRAALLEKVIRPMIKIAEASPYKKRLMTWELINEPEWAMSGASKYGDPAYECTTDFQCVSHEQMESFLADIAKIIREESKSLISVGGAAIKWKTAWTHLDMDFYQFHFYDWVNQYFPYTKSPQQWDLLDKPTVMGEYPFDGVTGADATTLVSSWLSNGFGGAMGWAVTLPEFHWGSRRDALKSFAEQNSCELTY